MGTTTKIGWCDATWNPWQGCAMVSPGCHNCYMFREKRMYGQDPEVVVRSKPPTFNLPLKMHEPGKKVFTCSWSDFFIKEADPWRDEAWDIIDRTRHLTYLILTKRIERALTRLPWGTGTPWPHVWLIVSVEDQETADRRLPHLIQANASIRGVSYEPALGPVNFRPWLGLQRVDAKDEKALVRAGAEHYWAMREARALHWIIVGGESDLHARPFDLEWGRAVVKQCDETAIPCYVKQLGSHPVCHVRAGSDGHVELPILIGKKPGYKWDELQYWPNDLKVRQWPAPVPA